MGLASPTRLFPFLSGLWIRVTHLDYKNPRHGTTPGREPSCTRMWPHENNVQTLNHHYHTLRPYPFSLNRRGITSTTAPPVSLIVAVCSKHSIPIILA